MLQIGKLTQPKVDAVTLQLEQLDFKAREWLPPFQVKVSLSEEKFASCLPSHSDIRWITASRKVCPQEI